MIEYIVCAATWFMDDRKHHHQPKNIDRGLVIMGMGHHNCVTISNLVYMNPKEIEKIHGFMTNTNRFVDRREAYKIAVSFGQLEAGKGHMGNGDTKLDSADLYEPINILIIKELDKMIQDYGESWAESFFDYNNYETAAILKNKADVLKEFKEKIL